MHFWSTGMRLCVHTAESDYVVYTSTVSYAQLSIIVTGSITTLLHWVHMNNTCIPHLKATGVSVCVRF